MGLVITKSKYWNLIKGLLFLLLSVGVSWVWASGYLYGYDAVTPVLALGAFVLITSSILSVVYFTIIFFKENK